MHFPTMGARVISPETRGRINEEMSVDVLTCAYLRMRSLWLCYTTPNETVEKALVRKMFKKNSHNRLKNSQNIAKMLYGALKMNDFQHFSPTFQK